MAKKRKLSKDPTSSSQKPPTDDPIKQEPVDDTPASELPVQENSTANPTKRERFPDAPTTEGDAATDADTNADGEAEVEEEDEEGDPASIQKLLEPFSREQLVELLLNAASRHPDVLTEVSRVADVDPAHRKIFVHGLGWDTTAEVLAAAFREYGEIEDCNAIVDKTTGKSKGYGFILFKQRAGAWRALKNPQKKIGSRMAACQLASTGPTGPPPAPPMSEYTQRKIYVSNVGAELGPQKLLQFFSKYGEIEEGPLGLDKATGKPKGFCLFVYRTPEGAKKALEEPHKNFEGHILHCQRAIDGPKPHKVGLHIQNTGGSLQAGIGVQGQHFLRNENMGLLGALGNHVPGTAGSLMSPVVSGLGFSQASQGFNQATQPAAAAAGLNPALGQALTAYLATQGAGLGLTNLLGQLGSAGMGGQVVNQVPGSIVSSGGHGMQAGYGNQAGALASNLNAGFMGGYAAQTPMQGRYANSQLGQGGAGRTGHMGGYMGN